MADTGFEQLLLEMGLDLSPVQTAADAIRQTLGQLNDLAAQVEAQASGAAASQGAVLSSMKETGDAAAASAKEAVASQSQALDGIASQTALLQQQVEQYRLAATESLKGVAASQEKKAATEAETAAIAEATAEEQRKLAVMRTQTAELGKQRLESAAAGAARGGGGEAGIAGAAGNALGDVVKGAFGTGVFGEVAGGVIAGAGIVGIIEAAGTAMEHFVDKLKEVSVESGSLVSLEAVFRGLANGAGIDAAGYMAKLQRSTEGLVSQLTLLKVATSALRSPYKLTSDAVAQLSQDVVRLSESSGHTAEEGMEALNQALTRGRPYVLGMATGIVGLRDVVRDMPPTLNAAARSTLEWSRAMAMLHSQAQQIGELPATLENVMTKLKVSSDNLLLAFGTGLNNAPGIQKLMAALTEVTNHFTSLQAMASRAGTAVGNVLGDLGSSAVFLAEHIGAIKTAFEGFMLLVVASEGTSVIMSFLDMATAIGKAEAAFTAAETAAKGLAAAEKLIGEETLFSGTITMIYRMRAAFMETTGVVAGLKAALMEMTAGNVILAGVSAVVYGMYKFFTQAKDEVEKATGTTVTWGDVAHGTFITIKNDLLAVLHGVKDVYEAAAGNPFAFWHIKKDVSDIHDVDQGIAQAQQERINKNYTGPFSNAFTGDVHGIIQDNKIIKPPPPDNSATAQQQARLFEEKAKAEEAEAKEELERKKGLIQQEKELDEAAYADSEETFAQHQANMRKIADESLEAQKEEAAQNRDAQIASLKGQVKSGTLLPADEKLRERAVEAQYNTAIEQAELQHQTTLSKMVMDGIKQRSQAAKVAADARLQAVQEQVKAEQEQSTQGVHQGTLAPTDYVAQREAQIATVAQAEIQHANDVYNNSQRNMAALEERAKSINKTIADAKNQYMQLVQAEPQIELQSIQRRFQPQQQALTEQLATQQSQQQQGANVPVIGTLQDLQGNLQTQMQAYQTELTAMQGTTQEYSDTWWQIYSRMEQVYELMVKYNQQLQDAQNFAGPIAQVFQSLDQIASLWTSKFAKNLSSVLNIGIKSIEESEKRSQVIGTALGIKSAQPEKSPEMLAAEQAAQSSAATFGALQDGTHGLTTSFASLNDEVQALLANLTHGAYQPPSESLSNAMAPTTPELGNFAYPAAGLQDQMMAVLTAHARAQVPSVITPAPPVLPSATYAPAAPTYQPAIPAPIPAPEPTVAAPSSPVQPSEPQITQVSPTEWTFGSAEAPTASGVSPVSSAAQGAATSFSTLTGTVQDTIAGLKALNDVFTNVGTPLPQQASTGQVNPFGTTWNQTPALQNLQPQASSPTAQIPSGANPMDSVKGFTTVMASVVSGLTEFVSAIQKSTSAVSGGVGGATSGFGVGNTLSKIPVIGEYAGAAGAVIGGVVGAIVGQKNSQVEDEVTQLSSQYSAIMESFSENTNNINETIEKLQNLMMEAEEDQANSKKGGSQFSQMISQYSQEIQSLSNEASSIISDMDTQLAVFQAPTGMQTYLNDLNSIIEQYDKFSGAASGASQLASANSWLVDSLSNFTGSLSDNFANDQESAINDALSLNDLLSERSDLISNLNDQVMGILEQGVVTRQQTTAQTKGQQIENIESSASDQLSTIDQEISLEQYKVSVEQYIFNLATTKIGLETQLLALQEQQSSQSLAAISALQQLIDDLQNGSYNFQTLQSLLNSLGMGGAANMLPVNTTTNSVTTNTSNLDQLASAAYQSRASLGYGNFRGQNL